MYFIEMRAREVISSVYRRLKPANAGLRAHAHYISEGCRVKVSRWMFESFTILLMKDLNFQLPPIGLDILFSLSKVQFLNLKTYRAHML